jgi:hypothetical protein
MVRNTVYPLFQRDSVQDKIRVRDSVSNTLPVQKSMSKTILVQGHCKQNKGLVQGQCEKNNNSLTDGLSKTFFRSRTG